MLKRPILLLCTSSFDSRFGKSAGNRKQKRKSLVFAVFARKRPFLSQIKR
nr:MAG TPA: hypothetical protein [Caudoviricetes sp.]